MLDFTKRTFFGKTKKEKTTKSDKQAFVQFSTTDLEYFSKNTESCIKSIDNDALNAIPVGRFEGEIRLIDRIGDVDKCVELILDEDIVGIDSETRPNFTRGERHQVALLQIATASTVYLFRLNKIGFPKSLLALFENPNLTKVGIALENDLPELRRFGPIYPVGLVDLNKLCPAIGFGMIGARKLSAMILGFRLSKAQQTSNWESEVLTEAQQVYAATDAWVCREIYLRICGIKPA
jgi:ribonuclease D